MSESSEAQSSADAGASAASASEGAAAAAAAASSDALSAAPRSRARWSSAAPADAPPPSDAAAPPAPAPAPAPLPADTSISSAEWVPLEPGVPPPVLTATSLPFLGVGGTMGTYPMPSGVTGTLNVGATPAAAAGLLGAGGIMAVLAAVEPTRVLVLLNAVSDADLRSPAEYSDVLADIAIEARGALFAPLASGEAGPVPRGALLAVRIPRPRRGESTTVVLHRKGRFRGAVASVVPGAVGLLEDGRAADASSRIPSTSKAFFEKLLIKEGGGGIALGNLVSGVVGMLTNGPAAPAPAPVYASEADASFYSTGPAGGSSAIITTDGSGALPADEEAAAAAADEERYDPFAGRTAGLGKVFLEFDTPHAAVAVQRELSGRAFNGRILATTFADVDRYRAGELCDFAMCGTGF